MGEKLIGLRKLIFFRFRGVLHRIIKGSVGQVYESTLSDFKMGIPKTNIGSKIANARSGKYPSNYSKIEIQHSLLIPPKI